MSWSPAAGVATLERLGSMKLAVNYSPEAARLVEASAVPLDIWKCSDWPALISGATASGLPHYVHFDLEAGMGDDAGIGDLDRVAVARSDSDTHFVNLHVSVRRRAYPSIPVESCQPEHVELALARTAMDVRAAGVRFGPERVIVENLPYRGPGGDRLRMGQDPAFVRRLCDETGCGFLLDVAHARTAARYLGLDERAYLSSLPVDRVRELHISGLLDDGAGGGRDEHMPLAEHDWKLLAWCLDEIHRGHWARPWALAFEYGGIGPRAEGRSDAAVLAAQLPRLQAMVRSLEREAEEQA